ncbi:MAG: hypothetical protein AMXMBFR44_3710 [Candidatus Campbellbacteria bacterium]
MKKSPLIHALSATAYIALVSLFLFYGQRFTGPEDNVLMPVTMLSLLVFSVAFMGFLFFWEPLQLYLAGDRQGALSFFLKTLGTFAGVTALLFVILIVLF